MNQIHHHYLLIEHLLNEPKVGLTNNHLQMNIMKLIQSIHLILNSTCFIFKIKIPNDIDVSSLAILNHNATGVEGGWEKWSLVFFFAKTCVIEIKNVFRHNFINHNVCSISVILSHNTHIRQIKNELYVYKRNCWVIICWK